MLASAGQIRFSGDFESEQGLAGISSIGVVVGAIPSRLLPVGRAGNQLPATRLFTRHSGDGG